MLEGVVGMARGCLGDQRVADWWLEGGCCSRPWGRREKGGDVCVLSCLVRNESTHLASV